MANKRLKNNFLDTRINNSWLHNTYVLYFIFIIALGNAYYLMASSDWYYLTMFFILGFLTSFFSKNIIVILCIALAATNIMKYGVKATMEGFKESGQEEEEEVEHMETEETNEQEETEEKKKENMETETEYENPTEESRKRKKDGFNQKPDGVYTSIDDMDIAKVYDEKDYILKNQEKILKNLNQYKPLLDTINSITKSVSSIKQSSNPRPA